MVQYEKLLEIQKRPEFEQHYIDYAHLKDAIKQVSKNIQAHMSMNANLKDQIEVLKIIPDDPDQEQKSLAFQHTEVAQL